MSFHLDDYPVRLIVAGSRKYNNVKEFTEILTEHISQFDKPILFISGKAATGADDLIIKYCKEHNLPCLEMPADWNNIHAPGAIVKENLQGKAYNVLAGMQRNDAMARKATHLLALSVNTPGTKNMIALAKKYNLNTKIVMVEI